MEQFVLNVRTHSNQGNLQELAEYLQKSSDLLARNSGQLANVLETLDIQQHSLGVMAVLTARLLQTDVQDWEELLNSVSLFLCECNGEQIRHLPQNFAELCHLFTNKLIEQNAALMGLPSLLKAMAKIQICETTLSSIGSDIFKVCLVTKCFHPALKLLNSDITDISKEAASDPKYILLYFYYGALILIAVKEYDRALYFLETCVTMPSMIVSHIMLEAYKKYLLVSLIVAGDQAKEYLNLPKYTSPVVAKYIKPLCNAYQELVNAFSSSNLDELQNAVTQYGDTFATDKNMGLVNQVKDSLLQTNIKRLTRTFLTLSLQDVACRVGLENAQDAEKWIVIMIQEGVIHATISQKDGMVRFDANPERFASVRMLKKLETKIKETVRLDTRILTMDEDIVLNPTYIRKSHPSSSAGGARKGSDFDLGDDMIGGHSASSATPRASSSSADGFFMRQTPPPQGNAN